MTLFQLSDRSGYPNPAVIDKHHSLRPAKPGDVWLCRTCLRQRGENGRYHVDPQKPNGPPPCGHPEFEGPIDAA